MPSLNQKNQDNNSLFEDLLSKNLINFAIEEDDATEVISSGSIQLNKALGIGGYPVGRITEIYGNESSGKTTLALHAIKEAQAIGKRCLFIDVENALDINYIKTIGIDINKLLIAHPLSGEQTFDIMEIMIKNKQVDLIVVDSVAAMIPEVEMQASFNEQQMGLHARLMSKGLRRLQSLLVNHECTIFFLNQIREKIGVFFGNPETTPGGRAMKFFTSVRIETRKQELIKDSNDKVGIQTKVTITKNKLAPPLKVAFISIYFENGFDATFEIIDYAIEMDVIKKAGSWYSFQDNKLGQGKDQLKKVLKTETELFNQIKEIVLSKIK